MEDDRRGDDAAAAGRVEGADEEVRRSSVAAQLEMGGLRFDPVPCLAAEDGDEALPAVPVASVALDACIVPSPNSPSGARLSEARLLVLDDFVDAHTRSELLTAMIGAAAVEALARGELAAPPEDLWERRTADAAGAPATWGLRPAPLAALMRGEGCPAMRRVGARLAALFPNAAVAWLPSGAIQGPGSPDCAPLLANAAVAGDSFSYHQDADPTAFPDASAWCQAFGDYFNGEPGRPLLASLVLYLNPEWRRDWGGETLLLDGDSGVGVAVQARPGRALLMHQDVVHRLVAPSRSAGRRPRFSLVWKLALLPRGAGDAVDLARRAEWGPPTPFGSAARVRAVQASLAREAGLGRKRGREQG